MEVHPLTRSRTFTPDRTTAALLLHRSIEGAGQTDVALWLSAYTGDNAFVLSVREGMRRFGSLTDRQEAAIRRQMASDRRPADTATRNAPSAVTPVIPDGTYTVVNDRTGGYRTIEITTPDRATLKKAVREGTQIAAYHSGPDNETQFTGFAWVQGANVEPFAKHAATDSLPDWKAALRFLLTGKVSTADAAHAYALKSGRCARCQRKLTVPASLHRGYGPECVKKAADEAARPMVVRGCQPTRQPDDEARQLDPVPVAAAPRRGGRTYADLFPDD